MTRIVFFGLTGPRKPGSLPRCSSDLGFGRETVFREPRQFGQFDFVDAVIAAHQREHELRRPVRAFGS
jgi:hypothetical protein